MTAEALSPERTVRALTRREQEILALLVERQTNREIADLLCIGPSTVATHLTNALAKLGATNRRDAGGIAIRRRLIESQTPGRHRERIPASPQNSV